jgi:aminoglycoside phosphotransferase (APT) family kinase protein
MILVAAAGRIPVPDVLAVEGNSPVGPLMVMRRVEGTVLRPGYGRALPDGDRVGEALVTMLARIHAVSFDDELAEITTHDSFGASLLDRWRSVLVDERRHHVALDAEALGLWLASDVPSDHSRAFLHGDYRLGNLMWDSSEVAAVLDWETSSIGNPLFDLAWLLMGTSAPDDLVMGVISRQRALDLYVDVTGMDVDKDELVWWELLATWCRVCMEVKGIRLAVDDNRSDLRFLLWEFGHRAVMASAGKRVLGLTGATT